MYHLNAACMDNIIIKWLLSSCKSFFPRPVWCLCLSVSSLCCTGSVKYTWQYTVAVYSTKGMECTLQVFVHRAAPNCVVYPLHCSIWMYIAQWRPMQCSTVECSTVQCSTIQIVAASPRGSHLTWQSPGSHVAARFTAKKTAGNSTQQCAVCRVQHLFSSVQYAGYAVCRILCSVS